MELRQYLAVIRRWWWLTALAVLVTGMATFVLTSRQPFFYESEATLVVRPRSTEAEETVRAIDTLVRGAEINSTFARVAESNAVTERAHAVMPDATRDRDVSVSASVLPGTNIIELRTSSEDAEAAADFAEAVATQTVAYIDTLNDVFTLEPLDLPAIPTDPAGPNKALNNALGIILGLVLGGVLAFLAEYLSDEQPVTPTFEIIDPETHAFNERYFQYRSDQELARSMRESRPFSVGLLKLEPDPGQPTLTPEEIRDFVRRVTPELRREDTLAHLGDHVFAILFPDTPDEYAEACIATIDDRLGSTYPMSTAVCQYGGAGSSQGVSLDGLMTTS